MTNYSLSNLWHSSPVRIVAVVLAILLVLGTYGLNLVPDPDKLATALTLALTILAGGEVTRSQVSSPATVAKLIDQIPGGQASVDLKAALKP
jgi:hypothetical protein